MTISSRCALVPVLLLAAQPTVAQVTALNALAPYEGETVLLPLAFDTGTNPGPVRRWTDHLGTFHAQWLPEGETTDDWMQMQILRGFEGVRRDNAEAPPPVLSRALRVHALNGYILDCAMPPVALPIAIAPIPGALDSSATYIGCTQGLGDDAAAQGFEVVFLVALGETHGYVLSWEGRDAPHAADADEVPDLWRARAGVLSQMALCPEAAAYPHCPSD